MKRDAHGRFVKGSPPGPGRPPLAIEAALTDGIKAACTAEQVAAVMDKLYALGMKGSVKALSLWLSYAVGKPIELGFEERLLALEAALKLQRSR